MTTTATHATSAAPWVGGPWCERIDIRDFIQRNYTPYAGDDDFLCGPTDRTLTVWRTLADAMARERAGGGCSTSTPRRRRR